MARIVLTMNGTVLRELALSDKRITIGRRPQNDLVIDSPAVSGEHAAITLVNDEAILEDLNSTNGTQVNGQPVRKHFLQDDDVIELAQYRIRYCAAAGAGQLSGCAPQATAWEGRGAAIRVLNGANAGRETPLTKALTTIGRPRVQVAVITQRADGFYLNHVEGEHRLLVNGALIAASGCRLRQGDVIEMVGTQLEFLSN